MRVEQELGILMGFTCISCIFLGTAIQTWANYPPYIAGSLSFVYFIGLVIFAWTGQHTFQIFQLNYQISKRHLEKDRDLEVDMGTLDDDMGNLTFQKGFSLLNADIMALVQQVRPKYDPGEIIIQHNLEIDQLLEKKKEEASKVPKTIYPNALDVLALGMQTSSKYLKKEQNTAIVFEKV